MADSQDSQVYRRFVYPHEYHRPVDLDKQLVIADPLMDAKLEFIGELIAGCVPKRTIVEHFRKKFNVSKSEANRFYRTTQWDLIQDTKRDVMEHRSESVRRLKSIIKRAIAGGDLRTAAVTSKYLDELLTWSPGAPTNLENPQNGSGVAPVVHLDNDTARDLARAIARAQAADDVPQFAPVGETERQED
jgi:hypothetical protein